MSESTVKVGDFFEESWGYDQTNVDFYEVVKVSASGQTIWMRHVQASVVRCNGSADYLAPLPGAFDGSCLSHQDGLLRKKVQTYSDRPCVHMTSYSQRLPVGLPACVRDSLRLGSLA